MTERFRLKKWDINGDIQYELYEHKLDKEELNNSALDSNYSLIRDSLIQTIDSRIVEADIKPDGIGRQIENVKPTAKIVNLTYGDIHNEYGKRTYLKPIKENKWIEINLF